MKKYKVLISNSISLFLLTFVLTLLFNNVNVIAVITGVILALLVLFTASMLTLKNFNYAGYTSIPTWKHIRNLFIYAVAVILGSICGYLL